MKIKFITADQVILINGVPEWCAKEGEGFRMPDGEWAVSFDTDLGIGEVEYTDYRGNKNIDAAEFEKSYAALCVHHQNAKVKREAREAESVAASEA